MNSYLEQRDGESDLEYHKRIVNGKLVDHTLSDEDYSELSVYAYGKEYSSDVARRMMYGSRYTLDLIDKNGEADVSGDSILREIGFKKAELQKERNKLQVEKNEYNQWLRENARDELIVEKIVAAIDRKKPIEIPRQIECEESDSEYILCFGDEHYGAEFSIAGIDGETINAYSPEIFEYRMWNLLAKTISLIKKEDIKILNVYSMGDFTDGVLRVGQLTKLRYGVVDSTVNYMEFITTWLNELSKYVRIKFQMATGNHSELRMFSQPRGAFKDENMSKVVKAYITARLADNPNFEFVDNPSGLVFDRICGFNVLGVHGEVKDLQKAINDFSTTYGKKIDILIAGHLHHAYSETVGFNREVIRVPSIIGVDDFSMELNKTSYPGALLLRIDEDLGKTVEYSIKLI